MQKIRKITWYILCYGSGSTYFQAPGGYQKVMHENLGIKISICLIKSTSNYYGGNEHDKGGKDKYINARWMHKE